MGQGEGKRHRRGTAERQGEDRVLTQLQHSTVYTHIPGYLNLGKDFSPHAEISAAAARTTFALTAAYCFISRVMTPLYAVPYFTTGFLLSSQLTLSLLNL